MLCFVIASCNSIDSRDKKIQSAILENVSKGLDKNAMQRIDSVVITRVDSLTMKAKLFIILNNWEKILNSKVEYSDHLIKNIEEYTESMKRYDGLFSNDTFYQSSIRKYQEYLKENKEETIKWEHSIDSLRKIYVLANGVDHWGYQAIANVYYNIENKVDTFEYGVYINKYYKLDDTANQLREYLVLLDLIK